MTLLEVGTIKGRPHFLESTEQADDVFRALLELAEAWEIAVVAIQFNSVINGLLHMNKSTGDWIISIEQNCSQEKKSFILAHELGHYVLHRNDMKLSDWVAYWDDDKFRNEKELEADRFAEELLALLRQGLKPGIRREGFLWKLIC